VGKTSLACQIARWGLQQELCRHRLLPVLIEQELEGKPLLQAIRNQLPRTAEGSFPLLPTRIENRNNFLSLRINSTISIYISDKSNDVIVAWCYNTPGFPTKLG
jgi:hypothetical protein